MNELKLPAAYAAIDEEEMTYLAGGDSTAWDTVLKVGQVFNYVARIFSAASSIINNFNTIFTAFNNLNTALASLTGSSS